MTLSPAKHEKLGKYWSYCTQNRAITTAHFLFFFNIWNYYLFTCAQGFFTVCFTVKRQLCCLNIVNLIFFPTFFNILWKWNNIKKSKLQVKSLTLYWKQPLPQMLLWNFSKTLDIAPFSLFSAQINLNISMNILQPLIRWMWNQAIVIFSTAILVNDSYIS